MRSEGVKRPNVAPYDGAGVFTKVGLSRRATALAVAEYIWTVDSLVWHSVRLMIACVR